MRRAISKLKNRKSAETDGVQAELLKAGGDIAVKHLTDLRNMAWESEKVPADLKDSILIPLPKQGDLTEY